MNQKEQTRKVHVLIIPHLKSMVSKAVPVFKANCCNLSCALTTTEQWAAGRLMMPLRKKGVKNKTKVITVIEIRT